MFPQQQDPTDAPATSQARTAPARSLLFVPGDRPQMLGRAPSRGADAIVVDLEDAVAPGRKREARHIASDWLSALSPEGCEVWVRVNGLRWLDEELDELGPLLRDGILLPKVQSADDAAMAVEALRDVSSHSSAMILVETARAMRDINEIAAVPGVVRVMLGDIDLGADLGLSRDSPGWDTLRINVVLASAASDLHRPIAGVYTRIEDLPGLEINNQHWAALGYGGRAAIHPIQVPGINETFSPTAEDLAWAMDTVASYEKHRASGTGVYRSWDGEMIDEAVVRRARSILQGRKLSGSA